MDQGQQAGNGPEAGSVIVHRIIQRKLHRCANIIREGLGAVSSSVALEFRIVAQHIFIHPDMKRGTRLIFGEQEENIFRRIDLQQIIWCVVVPG
ncbi:hypothetical protein D3C81_1771660 [compost metagenome]